MPAASRSRLVELRLEVGDAGRSTVTLLFTLYGVVGRGDGIDRDSKLAHADLDHRQEGAVAAVLVEPVGLDRGCRRSRRGRRRRSRRRARSSSVRSGISDLWDSSMSGSAKSSRSSTASPTTSNRPPMSRPVAEVAAAVVEIAAVELAERAGDEVEVAVAVDVAERDVGRQRLVAADVAARRRGRERRRRAVVEVQPVVRTVGQLRRRRDDGEDLLVRVGAHDDVFGQVHGALRRRCTRRRRCRACRGRAPRRTRRCRSSARDAAPAAESAAQRAVRIEVDVRSQRDGARADRRLGECC